MVKKLTEGIHVGLLKYLDMGDKSGMEPVMFSDLKRYRFCSRFGWTPDEYDRQSANAIAGFMAIMETEAKLAEMRNGK